MALAQNVFKTITNVVASSPVGIYTAPVGYSGVILLASATNIGASTQTISFSHKRDSVTTEVVKTFPIESSDTANLLSGKLVLESGDVIVLSASSATDVKFVGSVLETLN
tara:strand:+ start:49 stop:378 length:330 start_codon:yes stop_codon:yes gene_type:complete